MFKRLISKKEKNEKKSKKESKLKGIFDISKSTDSHKYGVDSFPDFEKNETFKKMQKNIGEKQLVVRNEKGVVEKINYDFLNWLIEKKFKNNNFLLSLKEDLLGMNSIKVALIDHMLLLQKIHPDIEKNQFLEKALRLSLSEKKKFPIFADNDNNLIGGIFFSFSSYLIISDDRTGKFLFYFDGKKYLSDNAKNFVYVLDFPMKTTTLLREICKYNEKTKKKEILMFEVSDWANRLKKMNKLISSSNTDPELFFHFNVLAMDPISDGYGEKPIILHGEEKIIPATLFPDLGKVKFFDKKEVLMNNFTFYYTVNSRKSLHRFMHLNGKYLEKESDLSFFLSVDRAFSFKEELTGKKEFIQDPYFRDVTEKTWI